ncbi:hypothetical protein EYF80_012608 [Liparis tanakae]|uniref:Uncharacterized protein n=1 Tax=Liparis tanakae TaxID=230148 RepID=A0A4Z2IGJ4_9TELE|nr:hypothetical protein EYF80_012608 [Liparis tanakae]
MIDLNRSSPHLELLPFTGTDLRSVPVIFTGGKRKREPEVEVFDEPRQKPCVGAAMLTGQHSGRDSTVWTVMCYQDLRLSRTLQNKPPRSSLDQIEFPRDSSVSLWRDGAGGWFQPPSLVTISDVMCSSSLVGRWGERGEWVRGEYSPDLKTKRRKLVAGRPPGVGGGCLLPEKLWNKAKFSIREPCKVTPVCSPCARRHSLFGLSYREGGGGGGGGGGVWGRQVPRKEKEEFSSTAGGSPGICPVEPDCLKPPLCGENEVEVDHLGLSKAHSHRSRSAAAIQKDLQLAGVNIPIVNRVAHKDGQHYKREAVWAPSPAVRPSSSS